MSSAQTGSLVLFIIVIIIIIPLSGLCVHHTQHIHIFSVFTFPPSRLTVVVVVVGWNNVITSTRILYQTLFMLYICSPCMRLLMVLLLFTLLRLLLLPFQWSIEDSIVSRLRVFVSFSLLSYFFSSSNEFSGEIQHFLFPFFFYCSV